MTVIRDIRLSRRPPSRGGGHVALEQAYRSYWSELCRYVRKAFGQGPPDPEEVAQSAFARLAALDEPHRVANPRAFLYQCARNIVLDHRRREAVRARCDLDPARSEGDEATAILDAERVLQGKQRLRIVDAAVRTMEPRRREVLVMHAIDGLNYSEIARRMGVSPTRVMQLFASALAECERALRSAEGQDGETGR